MSEVTVTEGYPSLQPHETQRQLSFVRRHGGRWPGGPAGSWPAVRQVTFVGPGVAVITGADVERAGVRPGHRRGLAAGRRARARSRCNRAEYGLQFPILRPDILVVYADRFEGFAAVIAGTQMGIPTAHIEGGDVTQGGALDDSVRHAMTKLAHLHFTTNENAANRIRVMGEEPWRVHAVGFPAIDLIADGLYATPQELHDRFGIVADRPLVVFTQHSVSSRFEEAVAQVQPSLAALETIAREGVQVVVTYPNNDAGGRRIIDELEKFRARAVPNVQVHKSVGRYNYHGMLALAGRGAAGGACVGNSSSGVKETPAFGCPTVDVGSRQAGRLGTNNVIATAYDEREIVAAIRRCLTDAAFIAQCHTCENPYGTGDAGPKIAEVLARVPLDQKLLTKQMTIP
ncbi:MAG: UDP-N-acetylglucosamine 2-epimerase (hydrolyzing) [Myxococcales bacterium]|nr:UDP-N-acetylglucosamine 2-epimerase (hydrolyzing) [Myxococcales bacterium]